MVFIYLHGWIWNRFYFYIYIFSTFIVGSVIWVDFCDNNLYIIALNKKVFRSLIWNGLAICLLLQVALVHYSNYWQLLEKGGWEWILVNWASVAFLSIQSFKVWETFFSWKFGQLGIFSTVSLSQLVDNIIFIQFKNYFLHQRFELWQRMVVNHICTTSFIV